MADAAVRVDIISGQNTVIKSVDLTKDKLLQLTGMASGANAGFENLSHRGLRSVEVGFRTLAFQAAGVPGPLGKIAEGALLLGGGTGILLGVAVAAGAVALAWQAMTKKANDLKVAIKELTDLLPKNDEAAEKTGKLWKQYGDLLAEARKKEEDASKRGVLPFQAKMLREDAAAIREKAAALKSMLEVIQITVDPLGGQPPAGKPKGATKPAKDRFESLGNAFVTFGGSQLPIGAMEAISAATDKYQASIKNMNEALAATPMAIEDVGNALVDLEHPVTRAMQLTAELVDAINITLLQGFMNLGVGLAEALAGNDSFGNVILRALGQMMEDIGHLLIQFGVQLTILQPLLANLLTSGPAMIAAGILISAAGAAVSKRAQGGHVSGSAARGGVSSQQMSQDQADVHPGTVTVHFGKDGFIRPSDPLFQEFIAQVVKEAKGRNVVFT